MGKKSKRNQSAALVAFVGAEVVMLVCFALFTKYSDKLALSIDPKVSSQMEVIGKYPFF